MNFSIVNKTGMGVQVEPELVFKLCNSYRVVTLATLPVASFIETTCKEIIETDGVFSGLNIISENVFASKDSARNWTEVTKPPKMNGQIIYAGDNGVVPGVFE